MDIIDILQYLIIKLDTSCSIGAWALAILNLGMIEKKYEVL